ncbi:MAG: hypothetical protein H6622_13260 [Halobacteriovoraceae bacterium]|nr:hypothetical protein [Halobacteriovoraceae bacterium]
MRSKKKTKTSSVSKKRVKKKKVVKKTARKKPSKSNNVFDQKEIDRQLAAIKLALSRNELTFEPLVDYGRKIKDAE